MNFHIFYGKNCKLALTLNISWREHLTNKELYKDIPKIRDTIRQHRLRFVGHCWRSKEEIVSDVPLWQPSHGKRERGRPATFISLLMNDTGCTIEELPNAMDNREEWSIRVNQCREISIQ